MSHKSEVLKKYELGDGDSRKPGNWETSQAHAANFFSVVDFPRQDNDRIGFGGLRRYKNESWKALGRSGRVRSVQNVATRNNKCATYEPQNATMKIRLLHFLSWTYLLRLLGILQLRLPILPESINVGNLCIRT